MRCSTDITTGQTDTPQLDALQETEVCRGYKKVMDVCSWSSIFQHNFSNLSHTSNNARFVSHAFVTCQSELPCCV